MSSRVAVGRGPGAVLVAALAILSLHHLTNGTYYLGFRPATEVADFTQRVTESHYLAGGTWPQSQNFLDQAPTRPSVAPLAIAADQSHRYGTLNFSGQAPWSYAMHLVFYPPVSLPAARIWLLAVDLVALAGLVAVAAFELRDFGTMTVLLGALSITAVGAMNSDMTQGQNAIFVTAAIGAVLVALRFEATPGRNCLAGLAMAVAFIKPTISALFVLAVLMARRPMIVVIGAVIALSAWFGSSVWTGVPMGVQWHQFDVVSLQVLGESANPVMLAVMRTTASSLVARDMLIGAGALLAIVGAVHFRTDLIASFAWLAIVSRLWTYHRQYDDVMLVFVLIALLQRYCRRASLPSGIMWLVCGASLWLPYSLYVAPAMQRAQVTVWAAAAGVLWMDRRRSLPV